MSFQVYCSIPSQTQNRGGILGEVLSIISGFSLEHNYLEGIKFTYREANHTYTTNLVEQADVVLLMHQNNKFDFDIDSLSNDSKKDFQLAMELDKRIFLLYRTKDGKLSIYDTRYGEHKMEGCAGTSSNFFRYLTTNVPDKKKGDHIDAMSYALHKHVAQIGKPPKVNYIGGDNSLLVPYNIPRPTPTKTEYIKTVGIVKPMYDRRLLI